MCFVNKALVPGDRLDSWEQNNCTIVYTGGWYSNLSCKCNGLNIKAN